MCSYEFCGNDAQYGHDCPPQVPFIYNLESCYKQDFNFPQNFQSFQQQYPCCERCGGPHESFQCQQVISYETCYENSKKIPICYDDDEDAESSTPLRDIIISELPPCIAITPDLSTNETKDSLIIGDEHLDTILEKELDKFINYSVENLVPNPRESEDECVCDVPEIYSNHLFDEEIISIKIDPRHLNAKSDLIESLLNQDSLVISSSKIKSLLDEFTGELIFLKSIPSRIDESDCDPEEEIRLIEKLLYDNSSPRPPEEINSENSDAVIKSFSPSPIPFEDSDPFMEVNDLFLTFDGSIPPDILDFSNVIRIPPPLHLSGDFFNSSLLRE
nr:hypothetical protein [Tanacetum cinerariifolium]